MKILTAEKMREVDRLTTERYGIPSLQLMENAGREITEYLLASYPQLTEWNIVILCGKGNNGGDGLVVARRLREGGAAPQVILFSEPSAVRGDAAVNLKTWEQGGGVVRVVTREEEWTAERSVLPEADLIVDAMLGTGLSGPVRGLLARVIEDVNAVARRAETVSVAARRPFVVAVDMPSGLSSDADDFGGPVVWSDQCVTLTAPKLGQLVSPRSDRVGKLVVRNIGTPPSLLEEDTSLKLRWLEPREFCGLPMARRRDAHKGNFGHGLVVAGSVGKSGAAVLSGRAALRSGAGLVTVATPRDVLPIVAAGMPELMTEPLESTAEGTASIGNLSPTRFWKIAEGKSVIAVGPGLSTVGETQEFIRGIVKETVLPVILDADGLNAFTGRAERLATRRTAHLALTPHPGEMARLLEVSSADVQAKRLSVAMEAAERWRAWVVLKGFHTILATPEGHAFINSTGNPGMATGGTGDVLTGMLAGLTAQFGTSSWDRVLGLGVYLHGLAGDLAAERVGEASLVASDLVEALPEAWGQVLRECDRGGH